jgi:hypothetical protein
MAQIKESRYGGIWILSLFCISILDRLSTSRRSLGTGRNSRQKVLLMITSMGFIEVMSTLRLRIT